ncbi:MAG: ATP-binding protein [Chlorobi bacterium]|nr:ATP-binding protein [Chlorobiota bacterium]
MVYKDFRVNIIIRILLISNSVFVFFYLLLNTDFIITTIVVGVLTVLMIWGLIRYVDSTNRLLNSFLESIKYSDFSRTFEIDGSGSSLDKLKLSFNDVIKNFREVKAEKDENYFYLQTVIQHIGIALIAFRKNGEVEFINNATKKLFQINSLSNLTELENISGDLVLKLQNIKHGENTLVRIQDKEGVLQLVIYATEFRIHDRTIILTSIKNIQEELEEKEMESWQKLIRVLTHEIMNSITPISSLSSTVMMILEDLKKELQDNNTEDELVESVEDVENALQTIHKRTDGLLHFVNTYRNLTVIPQPKMSIFPVKQMFDNLFSLFEEQFNQNEIMCVIDVDPQTLEITADEKLIEQVMINLIKNSIQSLEGVEKPFIRLKAMLNTRGRTALQVVDNGSGILPDVIDKIFIPFYTTKSDGSGIGLSLSKQIMRKHGGNISVYSDPYRETIFTLTF